VFRWLAARSFAAAALNLAYAVRLHDDLPGQVMADTGGIEKAASPFKHLGWFSGWPFASFGLCIEYL